MNAARRPRVILLGDSIRMGYQAHVHFNDAGYRFLGAQVARTIRGR